MKGQIKAAKRQWKISEMAVKSHLPLDFEQMQGRPHEVLDGPCRSELPAAALLLT